VAIPEGALAVLAGEILGVEIAEEEMRYMVLLSILLYGCAHKQVRPSAISTIPPHVGCSADSGKHWFKPRTDGRCHLEDARHISSQIACGERAKLDDGSEWIFPCFPEKNIPRCVKGCKLIAIVLGKPQLWRRFWS